jgi:hypothetical protein
LPGTYPIALASSNSQTLMLWDPSQASEVQSLKVKLDANVSPSLCQCPSGVCSDFFGQRLSI